MVEWRNSCRFHIFQIVFMVPVVLNGSSVLLNHLNKARINLCLKATIITSNFYLFLFISIFFYLFLFISIYFYLFQSIYIFAEI